MCGAIYIVSPLSTHIPQALAARVARRMHPAPVPAPLPLLGVLDGSNTSSLSGVAILATLTLEDLVSNGLTVDLNIDFVADTGCGAVFLDVFSAPESCFCLNDANFDGSINVGDILLVLAEFGCTAGCNADVTGDGNVNVSDLLSILSEFGQTCV